MLSPSPNRSTDRNHATVAAVAAMLLAAGAALALAGGGSADAAAAAASLLRNGWPTFVWWLAAAGYGFVIQFLTPGREHATFFGQLAFGGLAVLLLMWLAGWAHLATPAIAWAVVAVGVALLGVRAVRVWPNGSPEALELPTFRWPLAVGFAGLGVLLVAALVPPGLLWSPTEYGGYDALSYHLGLVRHWHADNAIVGYEHNVYSYLPNLVEAGYLHLALLTGGAIESAVAAQLMHASFTLFAALTVGRIVEHLTGRRFDDHDLPRRPLGSVAGAVAAGLYLLVPWSVVTGSLAYSEQTVNHFAAAALLLAVDQRPITPSRRGLGVGLLVGGAVLVKLTAAVMWAPPVALVLLLRSYANQTGRWRNRFACLIALGLGLLATVGLWAWRNAAWTGNPLFPLATDWLGTAHWTAEQAARWQAAHQPDAALAERLRRLASQLLVHRQYGYILLPVGVACLVAAAMMRRHRRMAVLVVGLLGVQLLGWLTLTHLQSRFGVPMIVPACLAVGLAIATAGAMTRRPLVGRAARVAAAALLLVMLATTLSLWLDQPAAAPAIGQVRQIPRELPPYATLNALPPGSRIYAEGFALPLYVESAMTYHTIWDASPLGERLERRGLPAAIDALRADGYTHLLVDWNMLGLWLSEGNYGYDRRITADRLRQLAEMDLPVVEHWQADRGRPIRTLYRLNPARR